MCVVRVFARSHPGESADAALSQWWRLARASPPHVRWAPEAAPQRTKRPPSFDCEAHRHWLQKSHFQRRQCVRRGPIRASHQHRDQSPRAREFLTLRVSPPAHPETTPRRVEVIRKVWEQKKGTAEPSEGWRRRRRRLDGWMREWGEGR